MVTENCNVCGSKQVYIRGRYPKMDNRLICPTCAYERLEHINEISSPYYGKVSAIQADRAKGISEVEGHKINI